MSNGISWPECDNRVCAGILPGPPRYALCAVVERHRPWSDNVAFAAALGHLAAEQWDRDVDCIDIADDMRLFGVSLEPPDHEAAVGIVFHMLGNLFRGRDARTYDLLGDVVRGYPARTLRRYRRDHGADPSGPLHAFMARVQYHQCLGALTRDGRSLPTARRWMERHPDWRPGQPGPRRYQRKDPATSQRTEGGT